MDDEQLNFPGGETSCPLCGEELIWFKRHKFAVEGKCKSCEATFTLLQTSKPAKETRLCDNCAWRPNGWRTALSESRLAQNVAAQDTGVED